MVRERTRRRHGIDRKVRTIFDSARRSSRRRRKHLTLARPRFPFDYTDAPTADELKGLSDLLGGSGGALEPPAAWEEVKDPLVAQYFPLRDGPEKTEVVEAFLESQDKSRFTIVAVERIQNVTAWQSFAVKRESIFVREPDEAKRAKRFERRLWHGTNTEVLEKIVQQVPFPPLDAPSRSAPLTPLPAFS